MRNQSEKTLEKATNSPEKIRKIMQNYIKMPQVINEFKTRIATQLTRGDFLDIYIHPIFDGDFASILVIFFVSPKINLRPRTNFPNLTYDGDYRRNVPPAAPAYY